MSLSLRSRIVLATFLPLVLFGLLAAGVGVRTLTATSEELALQRQTALTKVAAAGLASNLQAGVRVLDTTARDLGELTGRPENQQGLLLDRIASLSAFSAVVLLDVEGKAVAAVPPGTPTAGFDFAGQQFFREARAIQSPVFSSVFQYQPTGLPVTVVAIPVHGQGAFAGVLVGGFSLARPEWARDLNLVKTPGGSTAYLVDGAGTIIYRPGSTSIGDSIRSAPDLWQLASSGSPKGTVYQPNGAEDEVVVTYAPVGSTGWGLLIEEPWQPIVASVAPAQLLVAGLMGLGVVIALSALVFTLGRVVAPLGGLVEEGKRVGEGKPFRPLPEKGPPDLRVLLRAVNQLVSRLEEQKQALRSYAVAVLRAQEEERLRLSRELHDGAVQELVAVTQRLELYRDAVREGDASAEDRLQEVQELAQRGVVELRRMSNYLRPSVLEDLGLAPALQLLVRELGQHLPGTRIGFEVVGDELHLSSEMELTVFRIAQEALTNVRKHASRAGRVSVALVFDPREVTLVVEDDGPGLPAAQSGDLLQRGHLGLAGMAERARMFGGELSLEPATEKGTTVILRLPVAAFPEANPAQLSSHSGQESDTSAKMRGYKSMRFIISVVILFSLFSSGLGISSPTHAAECTFVLGFKALHDLAPEVVGDCAVDQRYNPVNGDSLQETTRGLLVWRKADNFTAFTNGYRTWVNGPFGVEQRLNSERFQWEAVQQLRNAEYVLPLVDPQDRRETETRIRLADGEYALISDSPPQRVSARLLIDFVATGDLNGDTIPDAVAPLSLSTGGSGAFVYLAAMIDRDGTLVQAGREPLGDRIKLNSIALSGDGTTAVDMTTHGPNDPLCCPTQRIVKNLQAAELVAAAGPANIAAGDVSIDTQGLFTSWRASVVRESAYDASQPPGPKGLPTHIQITFGEIDPGRRDPSTPVMYVIPLARYRAMWDEQGNKGIASILDRIDLQVRLLPSPPPAAGLPALPYEEIAGVNDLAVQVRRASVPAKSASRNGFRYVGRFAQDANPVSRERLRYVYQGFTNDGQYLVAFFSPVTTAALPAISDVPTTEFDRLTADYKTYMQEKAEILNGLSVSDWQPDLARLDAIVASLEIKGMPSSGITGPVWRWDRTVYQGIETPVADPDRYTLTFREYGSLAARADCNTAGGTYSLSSPRSGMAGGLRTGSLVTTLAECGPGSRYKDLMNMLAAVQDYELREAGQALALKWPAAGPVELFRKVPGNTSSP